MYAKIKKICANFQTDQSGGAGIEYAMIAGALAITIIGSVQLAGEEAQKPFVAVASEMAANTP